MTIIKVVLCGPPRSGKSCLREGLKQAILRIEGAPYPYVITACPDGEGAWFSEAAMRDFELARRLKKEYKAKFTPEFAQLRASWVRNTTETLNIIDVGGKISPENRVIMSPATHAVVLAGDMSKASAWKEFCGELGLQVIALIHSDYEGEADRIDTEEPLLTGSVHYLERGEDVSGRPMVQVLARKLVCLAMVED
jgi:CRISPR-associated protein Csx3